MPKTGALRTRLWLHRKFIFNFKLLSLFSIHCPRSLNAQSLYQFPSLSSSLLFQSEQIKCAIINQQTLGKKTLQFVLTWRFAAETNMPLITVSISVAVAVSVWLRVSRFVVKNASQDMALCALCTLCNLQLATLNWQLATCNPTYVQSFFTVVHCFAVTRHSHCLSVNRLFIHNYIIYRLINSTRNYFN